MLAANKSVERKTAYYNKFLETFCSREKNSLGGRENVCYRKTSQNGRSIIFLSHITGKYRRETFLFWWKFLVLKSLMEITRYQDFQSSFLFHSTKNFGGTDLLRVCEYWRVPGKNCTCMFLKKMPRWEIWQQKVRICVGILKTRSLQINKVN